MASRKGGTEYRKRVECDKVSNSENKPPKSPRFTLYTGTVPEDFVPLLKTEAAKLCIIYKDVFLAHLFYCLTLFSRDLWGRHQSLHGAAHR